MTQTKQGGLPPGFKLDQYTIVRELSSGGFSRVYLALDCHDDKYAIKEYLPQSLASHTAEHQVMVNNELDRDTFRIGLKCFFEEARVLAGIKHPNVVQVSNFFPANQTVYMVMSYASGRSLVREVELSGGALPEARLRQIFALLISGLREVHRHHLLHLDVKPANIYLKRNGTPVLLDFGAARQHALQHDKRFISMYTPGFAAPEQHQAKGQLGPWSDIYSVGACIYACMGIGGPPAANVRTDAVLPALAPAGRIYSAELLSLVTQCMALDVEARPGSLMQVQKVLNGVYSAPQPPAPGLWQRVSGWLHQEVKS
ncbi:serine/threonine protein kinase [Craterilacuibacter sp.]|uniref:serine/threonine protein kinase n=1 Tax=Craterilacuibacter sp. TaxID=2870909 RepID=UPI003F38A188